MSVTIKDIAKYVGVNPSTVSRVMNGTASISDETKKRIYDAMAELNYHPNSFARSLANGSTFTIGLVINAGNKDSFANAFFIQSVSAIETVAQSKGYSVLITNDLQSENTIIKKFILEKKVDGIILPVQCMDEELVTMLDENNVPFVVMGEPQKRKNKMSWVDVDNEQGSRQAVEHLIESGYHTPMLWVENKKTIFESKRIKGFSDMCKEKRIEDHKVCTYSREDVRIVLKNIVNGKDKTDCFICANNIVAYNILKEIKNVGLKVPDRIGLITFDNYPLAEYLEPPLTVIDIDTYRMGEQAAELLFENMKDKERKAESRLILTQLIDRESTRAYRKEKK